MTKTASIKCLNAKCNNLIKYPVLCEECQIKYATEQDNEIMELKKEMNV